MLTSERLKELLYYDPDTGEFTWLSYSGTRKDIVGKTAGGPTSDGYIRIGVDGTRYKAHRLAWFYMTGEWPEADTDHINGVKADNRWTNLRAVTRQVNLQNMREPTPRNKTGYLGVRPHDDGRGYISQISINNKARYLGYFATPEEAHEVYLKAKRRLHPGCTI